MAKNYGLAGGDTSTGRCTHCRLQLVNARALRYRSNKVPDGSDLKLCPTHDVPGPEDMGSLGFWEA